MPQPLRLLRNLRSSPVLLCLWLPLAAVGLLSLPIACTSAAQAREQCALDAVRRLPLDDPDQISVGDVIDLGKRIRACEPPKAPAPPDAGS